MSDILRFDESLVAFLQALLSVLSKEQVQAGWILRDSSGRLTFISAKALSVSDRSQVSEQVKETLPYYANGDNSILDIDQPGVRGLVQSDSAFVETVYLGNYALRGGNCPDWIVPSGMQCKAQIAPRGHSHASNLQRGSAPA
ncbi:MAG: hypothetical protein WC091_25050, partial [Sulfuricellaceae bacterium]